MEWSISITKKYGDATVQAREAAQKGADLVAGYGGDGTQHEIANGILGTTAAADAYTTVPGQLFTVSAPGVLENDGSAGGDVVTAVLPLARSRLN